jgi:hypothetical protein
VSGVKGVGPVGRWLLLVALVLGVALMHHIPASGGHGAHGNAAAVAAAHSAAADHGSCPCDHVSPAPADDTGHAMLHLCLAIIVGVAVVVALWLRRVLRPAVQSLNRVLSRAGRERFRPPLPVPRRLAVLCVLRL